MISYRRIGCVARRVLAEVAVATEATWTVEDKSLTLLYLVSEDKIGKPAKKEKRKGSGSKKRKGSEEKTRTLNVAKMLSAGRLLPKGSK